MLFLLYILLHPHGFVNGTFCVLCLPDLEIQVYIDGHRPLSTRGLGPYRPYSESWQQFRLGMPKACPIAPLLYPNT